MERFTKGIGRAAAAILVAVGLALPESVQADEALRFSSAAAAIKVSRFGGRLGAPDRTELLAFMAARRSDLVDGAF